MSKLFLILLAVAVLVIGAVFLQWPGRSPTSDAALVQPNRAIAALQARHPFTIGPSPENQAAASDPRQWRVLDRKEHFDAVLLTGDPALYRPLLDHLLHARDWTLVYLDHTSFGFKRAPVAGWDAASIQTLEQEFAAKPKAERVAFLVSLAGKLMAVDEVLLAKKKLEQAVALDDQSAAAWSQLAAYYAQSSLWGEALDRVNSALRADAKYAPALATKAQILLALHRPDEALKISTELLQQNPEDPQVLFKHANIAHEAHDYQGEVQSLRQLVQLAVNAKRPAAGYRIYLGQAYSRNGQRIEAMQEFQQALDSGELSREQQDYAREAIKRLSGSTGSVSSSEAP